MTEQLEPGSLAGGVLMTIHRLSHGGADRVAMLLANGFAAAGLPTAVAVLRSDGEGEDLLRTMLRDDVRVVTAGAPMGSRHLELFRGRKFIRELATRANPAIVMASSSNMGLVTALSAPRGNGIARRMVMKLTNPVLRPADTGLVRRVYRLALYRFIFSHYDQVIVLTDAERERLSCLMPKLANRFRTVPNPYVTDQMLEPFAREPNEAPQIVTLARMMPQKRLDRMLMVFARIACRDARLTIVGDGPERAALERLAARLGIADRVEMPGFADDVLDTLRCADLFLLTSDYEGLPAVILEALACNVPVVTTDCFDGARALLEGASRCAIVAREDIGALARASDWALSTEQTPVRLRELARPYSIAAGVAAHCDLAFDLVRVG